MFKVWWVLRFRHSDDGYFWKNVEFHKGHKYVFDYYQAKDLLNDVNSAIMMLGLAHLSETGMEKESDDETIG